MGMGPFAVESYLQSMNNVSLTTEEAFKIFMNYTHWQVDARLVSDYLNMSGDTIAWLHNLGVDWYDVASYVRGSYRTHHQAALPGHKKPFPGPGVGGPYMMGPIADKAKELGVQILLETPVKKIIKEDGKITGVIAEDKSGNEVKANAKSVIVCTGGFGDNTDMIKDYTGYKWGKDLFSMRVAGRVGKGIRMAWDVGAGKEGLTWSSRAACPEPLPAQRIRRM